MIRVNEDTHGLTFKEFEDSLEDIYHQYFSNTYVHVHYGDSAGKNTYPYMIVTLYPYATEEEVLNAHFDEEDFIRVFLVIRPDTEEFDNGEITSDTLVPERLSMWELETFHVKDNGYGGFYTQNLNIVDTPEGILDAFYSYCSHLAKDLRKYRRRDLISDEYTLD